MELTNYLSGIMSKFKDSRVVKNTKELVENIIEHKLVVSVAEPIDTGVGNIGGQSGI